jgi:hypothetical protein
MGHMRKDSLRDAFVDSGFVDKLNRYRILIAKSFLVRYDASTAVFAKDLERFVKLHQASGPH